MNRPITKDWRKPSLKPLAGLYPVGKLMSALRASGHTDWSKRRLRRKHAQMRAALRNGIIIL